jgi:hypothetical protein
MMEGRITRWLNKLLLLNRRKLIQTVEMDALRHLIARIHPKKTQHAMVRLGGGGDGGYVIPDDLQGIDACYSPGVAANASFELDMASRGIPCYLTDYSVDGPPFEHPSFHFIKKFLGTQTKDEFITLDDWLQLTGGRGQDYLLQMDIEGAEYDVLATTSDHVLNRFRIIIVEFHDLHIMIERSGLHLIENVFARLLNNFTIVHLHANNHVRVNRYLDFLIPEVMEFTFLRNDRIRTTSKINALPHPLDRPNNPDLPELILPNYWYH